MHAPFPAANRNNLTANIEKLLQPIQAHFEVECMCSSHTFYPDMKPAEHKLALKRCLGKHGVVVANYTKGMIHKVSSGNMIEDNLG